MICKDSGRAGLLIIDSSIDDLENVEITYTVGCKDIAANRDAIADWLFGSAAYAKLADSSDTSSYRMAICTSGQDWDEQIRNFGTAKLVFSCKPFRFLTSGDAKTTLTAAKKSPIRRRIPRCHISRYTAVETSHFRLAVSLFRF